jgi:hypothetical protein
MLLTALVTFESANVEVANIAVRFVIGLLTPSHLIVELVRLIMDSVLSDIHGVPLYRVGAENVYI